MGLSKEILRPAETRTAFSPASKSPSEIFPIKEAVGRVEARIRELSQMLFAESKKGEEKDGQPQKEIRTDGFEPFVNPEPSEDPLFVNGYNGNFAQQMELNRKGLERVLKIAHLEGQVFLTTLSPNRQRSIEANPDGSVSAKRNRFFGEKIEEDDKENPLHRVVPTPEGWRIEINDTRIMEELQKKKLTGQKLQTEFIQQFNGQIKQGLWECVWRENLSSVKDKMYGGKLVASTIILAWPPAYSIIQGINFPLAIMIPQWFVATCIINGFTNLYSGRKIDAHWEYFMLPIEIDKVVRAWAFLGIKGRTLVKEAKPETK